MARRKRKEEEADWMPPEFDEVGYMKQEMQGARAAVATIAWAVVGAIVAFLLFSVLPVLAAFAGIAVAFGLYFILPLFGIDTDAFKRKDWTGHGVTYFFSWLAFWIILMNPPFGDFTQPTVQGISVSPVTPPNAENLTCATLDNGVARISVGSNSSIFVLFRASDNVLPLANLTVRVVPSSGSSLLLTATPISGPNGCVGHESESYLPDTYTVTFSSSATAWDVVITASDRSNPPVSVGFRIQTT